ncbi:MAG: preprotein translocase subunit Sec61beta [Candidatus Njordarchaeales archaeon]
MSSDMTEKKMTKLKHAEERVEELPEIVTLYFQRADNPKKTVAIKTTINDLMDRVVFQAAKKLGIRSSRIGLTGGGEPINFAGKRVIDVLREHNIVSFQISSADMLGAPPMSEEFWEEEEELEEKRARRKSKGITTPPTGAGLLRFYEEEELGIKVGPKAVIALALFFVMLIISAWVFF